MGYPSVQKPKLFTICSNLLICRADLDETLVYQLTRAFFEALPQLARAHPAAGLIDPELAPATPIPLHPGAARYYKEKGWMN